MNEATVDAAVVLPPPEPAEVRAMREALDRGDHQRARALAATLLASEDPVLKTAGAELAARFRRVPWVDAVFVVTGLLMAFLAAFYLGHR